MGNSICPDPDDNNDPNRNQQTPQNKKKSRKQLQEECTNQRNKALQELKQSEIIIDKVTFYQKKVSNPVFNPCTENCDFDNPIHIIIKIEDSRAHEGKQVLLTHFVDSGIRLWFAGDMKWKSYLQDKHYLARDINNIDDSGDESKQPELGLVAEPGVLNVNPNNIYGTSQNDSDNMQYHDEGKTSDDMPDIKVSRDQVADEKTDDKNNNGGKEKKKSAKLQFADPIVFDLLNYNNRFVVEKNTVNKKIIGYRSTCKSVKAQTFVKWIERRSRFPYDMINNNCITYAFWIADMFRINKEDLDGLYLNAGFRMAQWISKLTTSLAAVNIDENGDDDHDDDKKDASLAIKELQFLSVDSKHGSENNRPVSNKILG